MTRGDLDDQLLGPHSAALPSAALDVWLDFLERTTPADDAAFEELCHQHPKLAAELHALRSEGPWVAGDAETDGASTPLADRLDALAKPVERGARFQRQGVIARGGMGVIHRVRDVELERTLALKEMIVPRGHAHGVAAARFLEEAQVTASLDHPGIVPVHEVGRDKQGRLYFAMKLVQGRDLKAIFDLVREGEEGWNQARALGVLLKVCEAMAYAHAKGVIHRDLKPGNVMVGRFGEVYVMDWGCARVLGRADVRDLRIRPLTATQVLRTPRHAEREETPNSPLATMDGEVLGTPAYMPPEQARGEVDCLSPRSDVYSLGAMLYHLLAGHMPFVPSGARVTNASVLFRVVEGAPPPVAELAPSAPTELVAICEKAMARAPEERYADTLALAEDLRAFLEGRVVSAHSTGPLAEIRKWVGRNRAVSLASAAGLCAAVAALAYTLDLRSQARVAAVVAEQRGILAKSRMDDILRLSVPRELQELERSAPHLWPPYPRLLPEYEAWLARARALVAGLDRAPEGYLGHRAKLLELNARGIPLSEDAREALLRRHERYPEIEELRSRLAMLRGRARARSEKAGAVTATNETSTDCARLNALAWPLVAPNRVVFGEEARGLALAQSAMDHADGDADFLRSTETLAWAFLAVGHDNEALAQIDRSFRIASDDLRVRLDGIRASLAMEIEGLRSLPDDVAQAERALSALEADCIGAHALDFASDEDRSWHWQLGNTIRSIEAFADPSTGLIDGVSPSHGWGIEKRRAFASTIETASLHGLQAKRLWDEACSSIGDPSECPTYGGLPISPQLGLLPIGKDPDSGLWEFAHLLSGTPPARDPSGKWIIGEDTGLVFVLVPGGAFLMGAQAEDSSAPNFDPLAERAEGPVHEVVMSPFFLSKYEMTQGQWLRFTGTNPSQDRPDVYDPEWNAAGEPGDLTHPVEMVSWNDCQEVCRRLGVVLPSEAQWEYAARGGTSTPWWTGVQRELVAGTMNVADSFAEPSMGTMLGDDMDLWLDDGNVTHARVGRYKPNPFGFHDVLGNVLEWCSDTFRANYYERTGRFDPRCDDPALANRLARGGAFVMSSAHARASKRFDALPTKTGFHIGLRPARAVDP